MIFLIVSLLMVTHLTAAIPENEQITNFKVVETIPTVQERQEDRNEADIEPVFHSNQNLDDDLEDAKLEDPDSEDNDADKEESESENTDYEDTGIEDPDSEEDHADQDHFESEEDADLDDVDEEDLKSEENDLEDATFETSNLEKITSLKKSEVPVNGQKSLKCPAPVKFCNKINRDLTKQLEMCVKVITDEEVKPPSTCPSQNVIAQAQMCNCKATTKQLEKALEECNEATRIITKCGQVVTKPKPSSSCKQIKSRYPSSRSGYYTLTINGKKVKTYCNMGNLCRAGGGWTRLAFLNMKRRRSCPKPFRLIQAGGVRGCARSRGRCQSIRFRSNGVKYSQVCGKVLGYQYGSPVALHGLTAVKRSINTYYVDGVSITHGRPRKHLWTYAVGLSERSKGSYYCPCNSGRPMNPLRLIGNDYYCESGNPARRGWKNSMYYNDQLWDGKKCRGRERACCKNRPLMPWFRKNVGYTTSNYLELRICDDEPIRYDRTSVSNYELYVR